MRYIIKDIRHDDSATTEITIGEIYSNALPFQVGQKIEIEGSTYLIVSITNYTNLVERYNSVAEYCIDHITILCNKITDFR